jgi:hypothetical protein
MTEMMTLHLADGTTFAAEVEMLGGRLVMNAGRGMVFTLEPASVRQVCHRLLEIINNAQDPVGPVKR